MPKFTHEIVDCPECTAPAEVVGRFVLESTDGPIEHAIVLCLQRHRFTMLVERLMNPPSAMPETVNGITAQPGRANPHEHPQTSAQSSLTGGRTHSTPIVWSSNTG
jgi:hypothetical protein